MKKFTLTIVIFLSQILLFAQCPPGDLLIFSSQAQVDEFQVFYPNCTELDADVVITGANITNLHGLNKITSITGNLSFLYNQALTNMAGMQTLTSVGGNLLIQENYFLSNLNGLHNVSSVGGDLFIALNNVLNSLSGLDNLSSVGGTLTITYNQNLVGLNGLGSLTTIGGGFGVDHNPLIQTLSGLGLITSIGGDLSVENNDGLTSITGLEAISSIGGDLFILSNYALEGVEGLTGLTSIGGHLNIRSNYDLTSLYGLDNIDASSVSDLSIFSNTSLSTCEVLSICNYLASPNGTILISNNDTGCKNQGEVETACEWVSVDELSQNNSLSIYPNPAYAIINIETTIEPSQNTTLTISNLAGQELITQKITEPKTTVNISDLPQGVYFVKVIDRKTVIVEKIVKK